MRRVRRAPSFTMRIAFALIALVSLLLVSVSADEKHGDGAVVHLEQETWDAVVAHGVFVVFFGATWCPHCVKLTPTWGELTTRVQDLRSRGAHGAHVAKVECTENEDLCGRMELQGYPSILTFVDGKRVDDYEGDRTLGELERYVRAQADKFLGAAAAGAEPAAPSPAAAPQAAPAVERKDAKGGKSNVHDDIRRTCNNMYKKDAPVSTAGTAVQLTAATFDEFVRSGSSAFVKFYAPWCTHCQRLQPVWEGLSSTLKDRVHVGKVDCTKETSLCQRFGIRAYPALKFFQKEDVIDYKGPRTMNALVAFCESQLE